ncbi:Os07g0646500 [Oryza sativa Japonica Group]|uniref:Os07g0646500 protein n=2 Tax=Oryza sativa subsp. japonica TaxID=39947 RepID=Q0D446_ORYSJ|nr:Os07g0646500 [Oryza sativa Japonica Group]|eukprot:NP_001060463.1 Os07g0646500 [Oryza sativa Japonica Group]
MAKRKAPSGPSSSPSPAAAGADASPPVDPVSYSSSQGGSAGGRNRKGAAAAAKRKPRKPQVHEKNYAHVYYGCRNVLYDGNDFYYGHRYTEEFRKVEAHDLYGCPHLIAELPPQPRLMSLLDLQLWIIKLFRLHPETQDLSIKGFFEEEDSWQYLGSAGWKTYDFLSDKSWQSFVKKVKGRKGMEFFKLYVDSSEIKHYDSLLKATNDDYCQSATVLLPEQDDLTWYFPWDHISRRLTEDLAMTTTQIVAHLAHNYDRHLSYAGAWRAKQKALEIRFGTFYASHNYVPRLLKERFYINNPFSFVDIKDTEVAGCKDFRVLHRIFWAFAQCTQAFLHCRPVICVKGMPLCGKYEGVLLTALAFDANGYPIPVAFAVIEGESKESWLWFLRNVKHAVVKERSHICIIHDCKRALFNAIEDLRNNPQEAHPWKDVQSRWCIQHLAENLFAHFADKKLMMLFKKLCQQNRQNKFVKIWKELDELTLKFTVDKEGGAGREMMQELVEPYENNRLPEEDEEESNRPSGNKSQVAMFSDWISQKPMEKWSLLHDTNGARYGIMETDINKSYHVLKLKGIECLPLTGLVEVAFERVTEYFNNRSAAANKATGNPSMGFPECVQDEMNAKVQKAQTYHVTRMNTADTNVFSNEAHQRFKVQSRQKGVIVHLISKRIHKNHKRNIACQSEIRRIARCSCNKARLLHKPCSHVIAVCCQVGVSIASYMSPFYSLSYLVKTWSGKSDASNLVDRNFARNVLNYKFLCPGETQTWIPDKRLERGLPAFLTSDRIHDEESMDEGDQNCTTQVITTENSQGTNKFSGETSDA